MKQFISKCRLLLAAGIFTGLAAQAQQQEEKVLQIGDQAPPLTIMKWVKGTPVKKFEKGKLYLVEFTGTGCPPCRRAMPHLTKLSRMYGDKVQVISVFDGLANTGLPEYMGVFNALFNEYGSNMDYTIAIDKENSVTIDAWMVRGVPQVFLVDGNGKIAWKGGPHDMDVVVENAAAGNIAKGVAQWRQQLDRVMPAFEKMHKLNEAGQWQDALKLVDSMIAVLTPEKHCYLHALYTNKFMTLAGNDDERAYDWLSWMLSDEQKADMASFDWDHFAGDVQYKPKYKNYDMQLAAIDRCIELAEYKYIAGAHYGGKARVYTEWSQHRATREESRRDSLRAVEMYGKAIEMLKQSGEENKFIAEMYDDRSKVQPDAAAAADDRKQAIAYYQKAIDVHTASKSPVKFSWFITDTQERMDKLK